MSQTVFVVQVSEDRYRRRAEQKVRGLLTIEDIDAYVDTVPEYLSDDQLEVTMAVNSPSEATHIKQKISQHDHVVDVGPKSRA